MEEIKKEGWVIGVMALLFAVINRINQNAEINRVFVFTEPQFRWRYYVMTVVALVVSFLFFAFLIWIVFELGRWHHKKCEEFIKYFLVYFAIHLVILILIWPGNFKQDEYYLTVAAVDNMQVFWTQSFFTQMHYTISLMIFPYVASIVLFQIFMISLLAAGIMQKTAGLLQRGRWAWCLLLPFLLLPVLDSNQFPLRSSMISWVFLFLVVYLYTEYEKRGCIGDRCMFLTIVMSVFIGVWRTEFLYLVPVLILIFVVMRKDNRLKVFVRLAIASAIVYFVFIMPYFFFQPNNNYKMTAMLTPVSEILVKHQYDHDVSMEDEFRMWDSYLPIDELKQEGALGFNVPVSWYDTSILDKKAEKRYMMSAVKLCLHYPKDFLANRFKLFYYSNGFVPNIYNHGRVEQDHYDGMDIYTEHFRFTRSGNPELKSAVIAFLACRENGFYLHTNFFYPILYNSVWGSLLLCVFGIVFLVKKKYFKVVVCGVALCQVFLVFLAAPAPFFMYYMPIYLTSCTLVTIFVLEWVDKRTDKRSDVS